MIGFFPTPYPDELLYSVCARYGEAVGYPSRTSVVAELFGSESAALVDLPMRLNHLLRQLPQDNYSLAFIVGEHTLFRFYAPFSFCQRIPLLLEGMGSSTSSSPRIRLGVTTRGSSSHQRSDFALNAPPTIERHMEKPTGTEYIN